MGLFDAISSATSAVTDLIGQAASTVTDKVTDVISDVVSDPAFLETRFTDSFDFDDALACFDKLFERNGIGGVVNEALDRMGLPDVLGDVVGTVVDLSMLNFPGAALNGLDAAENILRATGHEEIAGYIDTALPIMETVTSVATQAALMVVTGGGSSAVTGASTISSIMQGLNAARGALEAGSALQKGDYLGAGTAVFGALASFAGMGDLTGLSPETLSTITDVASYGAQATQVLGGVFEDGEVDLSDLQHVPVLDLLGAAGVNTEGKEDIISGLVGLISGSGDDSATSALLGTFADSLIGAVSTRASEDTSSTAFVKDMLQTGVEQPQLLETLATLLSSIATRQDNVNLTHQHAHNMRV